MMFLVHREIQQDWRKLGTNVEQVSKHEKLKAHSPGNLQYSEEGAEVAPYERCLLRLLNTVVVYQSLLKR